MKEARRASAFRVGRRVVGGLLLLVALFFAASAYAVHRAKSVLQKLLDDFASNTVVERSDSVYRLHVGKVRLNWALRHVGVDTAVLTTDGAVNASRARPLPTLRVGLYGCTVTGVSLHRLVLSKGLLARRFGCSVVTVDVEVPRHAVGVADSLQAAVSDTSSRPSFLVMQQGLRLPSFAPRIRVRRIDFPHTSFVLRLPRAHGSPARLALEHFEWHIRDMIIDPDDPIAATRPLFSRAINVGADNFAFQPDSVSRIGVGKLRINLTDSTVTLADISMGPTVSDAVFARQRPWRRSRLRMAVGKISADGVDFGVLMRRGGVSVRHLDLDSFVVDVWSDKRLPRNPRPKLRLTPQGWLAAGPVGYRIDTITVRGRVTYREVREGHDQTGVLTFNRLRGVARNVHHVVGRSTYDDPMRLTASAYLMNAGRLEANFLVPLDAPRFTMNYWGTLDSMPATAFNDLVEHIFPARITGGQVDSIRFRASVRNGVASGALTPYYHDFDISVTGRGASGILGRGGELARMVRGVATWFANQTKIRSDNPERPGRRPRSGTINQAWVPTQTLPAFVWASLRDALLAVIRK